MSDVLIVAENLVKSYGDVKALRGVSFKVERGKFLGILALMLLERRLQLRYFLVLLGLMGAKRRLWASTL